MGRVEAACRGISGRGAWQAVRAPAGDTLGAIAAMAMLGVWTWTGAIEQAPAEPAGSATSRAEDASDSRASPPVREVMLGGYVGAPYTYNSDVTVKKVGQHDLTAHDVGWDGEPFIDPLYYGARIVRWFEGGQTGAMIDFTHSKVLARLDEQVKFSGTLGGATAPETAKLRDIFRRLEATHGHNMLTLNGLMRLSPLGSRLFPYVGLGAGVSLPHSEVQMMKDPGRTYEYQYTGPVAQAVIGIELRVPRMSYFLEYKFSLASYEMPLTHRDGSILFLDLWRQLSRWWSGEEPPGGRLATRLTSHQVIGGLGVRFAGPAPAH